jgi:hypothetical protein
LVLLDKTQVANKQNQIGIQIFKLLLTWCLLQDLYLYLCVPSLCSFVDVLVNTLVQLKWTLKYVAKNKDSSVHILDSWNPTSAGLPFFLVQRWEKYTKLPQNIPNSREINQCAVNYTKGSYSIPIFSISKSYNIWIANQTEIFWYKINHLATQIKKELI